MTHLLATDAGARIEAAGAAEVSIAGRSFRVSRRSLDDIAAQLQRERIATLGRPLLVMHAPTDTIAGIENARLIFDAARHPKSFIALGGADHLLSDRGHAADMIAAWANRYLDPPPSGSEHDTTAHVRQTGRYTQRITAGHHALVSDEPVSVGGADKGMTPYDLLLASLGACTSMTLRMYADRKGWPLHETSVDLHHSRIHAKDCAECDTKDRNARPHRTADPHRWPSRRRPAATPASDHRPLPSPSHAAFEVVIHTTTDWQ